MIIAIARRMGRCAVNHRICAWSEGNWLAVRRIVDPIISRATKDQIIRRLKSKRILIPRPEVIPSEIFFKGRCPGSIAIPFPDNGTVINEDTSPATANTFANPAHL